MEYLCILYKDVSLPKGPSDWPNKRVEWPMGMQERIDGISGEREEEEEGEESRCMDFSSRLRANRMCCIEERKKPPDNM